MARVNFNSIFKQHPDGAIEPIRRIKIRGAELGPGVRFAKGTTFIGVDFTLFKDHDLNVDEENGVVIIKGIYK